MPIYEYSCGKCGTSFENLAKSADEAAPACPRCGTSEKVKRTVSGFSSCGGCGSGPAFAPRAPAPRRFG